MKSEMDHIKTTFMKKLLVFFIALLVCTAMYGQQEKPKKEAKHFLAVHAGPSFPMGDFKATSFTATNPGFFTNWKSGFATTGFNINADYGYRFAKEFGITASVMFNNYDVKSNELTDRLNEILVSEGETDQIPKDVLKLNHWKWYGLAVGPTFSQDLGTAVTVNLKVMGGIANVNCPKTMIMDVEMYKEDWSVAPMFMGGLDFRFDLGSNIFLIAGANYQYMRPKFTIEPGQELKDLFGVMNKETAKQEMTNVNLNAGFGYKF